MISALAAGAGIAAGLATYVDPGGMPAVASCMRPPERWPGGARVDQLLDRRPEPGHPGVQRLGQWLAELDAWQVAIEVDGARFDPDRRLDALVIAQHPNGVRLGVVGALVVIVPELVVHGLEIIGVDVNAHLHAQIVGVSFCIDVNGKTSNHKLTSSSGNAELDRVTLQGLPFICWEPARDAKGKPVKRAKLAVRAKPTCSARSNRNAFTWPSPKFATSRSPA